MKNLPIEVLQQIFLLLHQQDKLECMAVCHSWHQAIEGGSLFHTVRISSEIQLNKLIEKVQQEPIQGSRVERLIFDVDCIKHHELDMLPFLFPNVRVFIFSKTFDQFDIPLTKRLSPHPWHNNIEHIAEYLRNSHTTQTLTASTCSYLTRLMIYGKMGQSGRDFIDLLANAPSLKSLTVRFYSFKLSDFELLHKNVPHLSSLSIENADINCSTTFHEMILPATNMQRFSFKPSNVYPVQHEITLLQYLGRKYPNLITLSHAGYVLNEEEYDVDQVLKDGYAPLMEALSKTLESFSLIYYDMTIYPFHVMDQAHCKIKDLTLSYIEDRAMVQLSQSNQVKCIETLTLTALLKFSTLEWLKGFIMLKELKLCFPNPGGNSKMQKIDLNELLDYIGNTLEILTLGVVQLSCHDAVNVYPRLKSITFRDVGLPLDLDRFISRSLPYLRHLVFDHCFWSEHAFVLPNINLSSLKIVEDLGENEEEEKLLVKTLNNSEQRWYSAKPIKNNFYYKNQFDTGDLAVYPAMSSLPFDKFNGSPLLTIVCHSLQNIFMVNSIG